MAARSQCTPEPTNPTPETSKQLLYCEKFESGLGEKLKIVGKKTTKEAGPKKTFRPPPSSVLNRVQDFLPKLALANEELLTRPSSEFNIDENVDAENNGPMIEMDFALVPAAKEESSSDEEEESSEDEHEDVVRPCET